MRYQIGQAAGTYPGTGETVYVPYHGCATLAEARREAADLVADHLDVRIVDTQTGCEVPIQDD
jgi:hypothetical protein